MQLCGKGVRGVYQQLYVMLCAECSYFYCIHRALQADAIMQRNFLFIPLWLNNRKFFQLLQVFGQLCVLRLFRQILISCFVYFRDLLRCLNSCAYSRDSPSRLPMASPTTIMVVKVRLFSFTIPCKVFEFPPEDLFVLPGQVIADSYGGCFRILLQKFRLHLFCNACAKEDAHGTL